MDLFNENQQEGMTRQVQPVTPEPVARAAAPVPISKAILREMPVPEILVLQELTVRWLPLHRSRS